ncbi:MAG: pyridoxal phosphate-dependent aminotransferase [Enterocloster bolteae]|uniref:pyridoxal phosphate-dependent aminotransferase n=1 Tax=Enterocloster bolteae TaxID=208479 RepID=UPI00399283F3
MLTTAERMEHMPFSGIRVVMEKATQMDARGEHVIHLELGRPDFDTPQVIKEAAYKSLEKGNVFYTSNYGSMELRTAVAEKLRVENNIHYDPSEILITVGVGEGTFNAFGAYLEEGDEVLIPDPVWLNYIHVPEYFGAKAVPYTLKQENDYQIDMEELESKITDRTKMVVIISPNNPTGGVLGRETLEKLADIAIRHDLYVISDEIYEKLIFDGEKHISIASLPGMKERTITLNGFSKAYSMTGWRLGYMAAPKDIISASVRLHQHINTCASSFVQEAGITALKQAGPDVQKMLAEYQRRRDYVVEAINQIDGLSCNKPKGAFYLFINIKELGKSAMEMAEYFLEEAKVAMVPGTAFGATGEGICACPMQAAMKIWRSLRTH